MTEPELKAVDEEQIVIDYLSKHPEWLAQQADLLKSLDLHGKGDQVISLADRQIQQLREENKLLKKDLRDFVANARSNEELLHKIFKLCIALLYDPDAHSLHEHLQQACAELFDIHHLRLFFFNADFPEQFLVSRDDAKQALGDYLTQDKIVTGRLRQAEREFLFNESAEVASIALIPFKSNDNSGLLALGSDDEQHFAPENGDLFLSLFSRTLSLWLTQNKPIDE